MPSGVPCFYAEYASSGISAKLGNAMLPSVRSMMHSVLEEKAALLASFGKTSSLLRLLLVDIL